MPVYNPYAAPSGGGDYIEFPVGTPASIMDNYYRAVLASRGRDDKYGWTGGINAVTGALGGYGEAYIKDSFARDADERNFQQLLEELAYRDRMGQEEELRKRDFLQQDYAQIGEASRAWAEANQPGPDTTNVYEIPGYDVPPQPMDIQDAEGNLYAGESVAPETVTETIPGERPAPIDAWLRLAGQNPVLAGLLQQKMGGTFGQSVLDPSFQENRQSQIRERTVRSNRNEATTPGEVARLESVARKNQAGTRNLDVRTNEAEYRADLRQKALRLIDMGTPEARRQANILLNAANGRATGETALERESAKYKARTDIGLSADKPLRSPAPKGPSQFDRDSAEFAKLELQGEQGRTPTEEVKYQVLKRKLMTGNAFQQWIVDQMTGKGQQSSGGGTNSTIEPKTVDPKLDQWKKKP